MPWPKKPVKKTEEKSDAAEPVEAIQEGTEMADLVSTAGSASDRMAEPEETADKRYGGMEPGVLPESRRFGGGGDRIAALAGCHVNGQTIESWADGKSDFEVARMAFAFTDEGLEQQRRAEAARSRRHHGSGREATDESEKWMLQRGDQRLDPDFNPGDAVDHRADLAARYVGPGFAPKFVAEGRLRDGRDPRGYEVVKDEKGDVVRDGTSILAQIPEARAAARRGRYQREHNNMAAQISAKTGGEGSRRGRRSRTGDAVMERGESLIPPPTPIGDGI